MGSWGVGIWSNDTALDVKDILEDIIKEYGKDKAFELTNRKLEIELDYVDGVFAYADTLIEIYGKINSIVAKDLDHCIKLELNTGVDTWHESLWKDRVKAVREFATKVEPYLVEYYEETGEERYPWYN